MMKNTLCDLCHNAGK